MRQQNASPRANTILRITTRCLLRSAFFGAGLLVQGANLTVTNTQFLNNTAHDYGGGIVQLEAGFMDVENSIFDGNVARYGGGALAVATESQADRFVWENNRARSASAVRCKAVLRASVHWIQLSRK